MKRRPLERLPEVSLPPGYFLRSHMPGDAAHWVAIINRAFGTTGWTPDRFRDGMTGSPFYQPGRILFVCAPDGVPCATASAFRHDAFGERTGYLHMVGVRPDYAGLRLGYAVSLAALHRFRCEGCEEAVLHTDDHRLAALKTYLRLGFEPCIVHENQPARWAAVRRALGQPPPGAPGEAR